MRLISALLILSSLTLVFCLSSFADDSTKTEELDPMETIQFDTLSINKVVFMNNDSDKVEVIHDSRLYDLIEKDIRLNIEKENRASGYRVQISSSAVRLKSNQSKSKFLSLYPETKAHIIFEQPNYKVRVGDFSKRLDAQKALNLIKPNFPASYIVKDVILITNVKSR
ncbi:MAG: SPOR domain-containing protein [Flavobacteriales bacterium]|nr:SPOR domain-containing protein [Flavobacteriales bacterium]